MSKCDSNTGNEWSILSLKFQYNIFFNNNLYLLKLAYLFSFKCSTLRCTLRCGICDNGYISLPAAQMLSQMCHWEYKIFSLMNSFITFSCLLCSRQLPNTFQPLFGFFTSERWDRELCFVFFMINSNLHFCSSVSNSIFVFSGCKVFFLDRFFYLTFEVFMDTDFIHSGLKVWSR